MFVVRSVLLFVFVCLEYVPEVDASSVPRCLPATGFQEVREALEEVREIITDATTTSSTQAAKTALAEIQADPIKLANRSGSTLSHSIASHIVRVVLEEVLDVPTQWTSLDSSEGETLRSLAWPRLTTTASAIDVHIEDWDVRSSARDDYDELVTNHKRVMNAGPSGYPGLHGLYIHRPTSVANRTFADRLQFYRTHTSGRATDLFPALGTASASYARFVPPQCLEAGRACAELYAATADAGPGVAEKLVVEYGLPYVVVYVGDDLQPIVEERASAGDHVIFSWYQPSDLTHRDSVERVLFPRVSGNTSAVQDFEEVYLSKLVSSRVHVGAPYVFAFLSGFRLTEDDILGAIHSYRHRIATTGEAVSAAIENVACQWSRDNVQRIMSWMPICERGQSYDISRMRCIPDCPEGHVNRQLGNGSCVPCPMGTSATKVGTGSSLSIRHTCISCQPGYFSDTAGSTICSRCSQGRMQAHEGATACEECPAGTYTVQRGAKHCVPCAEGHAQHQRGSKECHFCDAGRYSNMTGAANCSLCEVGTATSTFGATQCQPCGAGQYQSEVGRAQCADCPANTFSSGEGPHTDCEVCPEGLYTQSNGSTSEADCGCDESYFQAPAFPFVQNASWVCWRCPIGLRCPQGSVAHNTFGHVVQKMQLLPGYMAIDQTGFMPPTSPAGGPQAGAVEPPEILIFKCEGPDSLMLCPGGLPKRQGPGSSWTTCGTLTPRLLHADKVGCRLCLDGYHLTDQGYCDECQYGPPTLAFALFCGFPITWIMYLMTQPSLKDTTRCTQFHRRFVGVLTIFPPYINAVNVIRHASRGIMDHEDPLRVRFARAFSMDTTGAVCLVGRNDWRLRYALGLLPPICLALYLLLMYKAGNWCGRFLEWSNSGLRERQPAREQDVLEAPEEDRPESITSETSTERMEREEIACEFTENHRSVQRSASVTSIGSMENLKRRPQFSMMEIVKRADSTLRKSDWMLMTSSARVLDVFGTVMYLMQIAIATNVTKILDVYEHPPTGYLGRKGNAADERWSVRAYPEALADSWEWWDMLIVCVGATLVYNILFLAVFLQLNIQAPKYYNHLSASRQLFFRTSTRFMLSKFRPGLWWWGVVCIIKNLIVAYTPSFFHSAEYRIILLSITIFVYTMLQFRLHPWKCGVANTLEIMTNITLVVVLVSFASLEAMADDIERSRVEFIITVILGLVSYAPLALVVLTVMLLVQDCRSESRKQEEVVAAHRFRQYMSIASRMKNSELMTLLHQKLDDHDREVVQYVLDVLTAELLKFQPSPFLHGQRLIRIAYDEKPVKYRNVVDDRDDFLYLKLWGDERLGVRTSGRALQNAMRLRGFLNLLRRMFDGTDACRRLYLKGVPDDEALWREAFEYFAALAPRNRIAHQGLEEELDASEHGWFVVWGDEMLKQVDEFDLEKAVVADSGANVWLYREEFIVLCCKAKKRPSKKLAEDIYSVLDVEGRGCINADDLLVARRFLGLDRFADLEIRHREARALELAEAKRFSPSDFRRTGAFTPQHVVLVSKIQRAYRQSRKKKRFQQLLTRAGFAASKSPVAQEAVPPPPTNTRTVEVQTCKTCPVWYSSSDDERSKVATSSTSSVGSIAPTPRRRRRSGRPRRSRSSSKRAERIPMANETFVPASLPATMPVGSALRSALAHKVEAEV